TVSGDVDCVRCGGVIDANSVSGDLAFHACAWPSGHVRTISGDLLGEVRLGEGPFGLTTISGDVQLVTPSPFTLRFDTTSGDLQASGIPIEKLGRRTYAAHVGNQGADIMVHTVSGDVAVRRGDVDAPEVPVGKQKVNMSIPLSLARLGRVAGLSRMVGRFGIDLRDLARDISSVGKVVDIADEDGDRVEIYVE